MVFKGDTRSLDSSSDGSRFLDMKAPGFCVQGNAVVLSRYGCAA